VWDPPHREEGGKKRGCGEAFPTEVSHAPHGGERYLSPRFRERRPQEWWDPPVCPKKGRSGEKKKGLKGSQKKGLKKGPNSHAV